MTRSGIHRVRCFGLSAVVLVAGLAMSTGWTQSAQAQDAPSGQAPSGASHDASGAGPPAAQRGSDKSQADQGPTDKGQADRGQADRGQPRGDKGQGRADKGSRPGDKGQGRDKGSRSVDQTARDPIDTRIPIQSRDWRRKAHDGAGATKPNTVRAGDRQRSRSNASTRLGAPHEAARNAVGVPVAPSGPASKPDAASQGSAPASQSKAADGPGTRIPGRDAITGTRPAPFAVQKELGAIKPGKQPGTVNGSTLQRPGQGPATVGGAARVVGGTISGSSFRPRH